MPARHHATPSMPPAGEAGEELRALAAAMLAPSEEPFLPEAGMPSPAAPGESVWLPVDDSRALTLSLVDVLGDGNNEVVLANEAGLRGLVIEADEPVIARGIAEAHVTALGEEVGGLAFVTFASGVTLYFPPELDLATAPLG